MVDDKNERWKVTEEDWKHHKQYDQYTELVERMFVETSTHYAPWTIVEATCLQFARVKIAETLITSLESRLNKLGAKFMTIDEREKLIAGAEVQS